jgi:hypothetical protein
LLMGKKKRGAYFIFLVFVIIILSSIVSAGIFDWFKGTGKASSQTQNVSLTVTGGNPVTVEVPTISANPIEFNSVTVNFVANVSDPDGVNDINDSSVVVKFTNGATVRNGVCSWSRDISTIKSNYSCSVVMWYFDQAGSGWTLNVSASDLGSKILVSGTSVFTYNELRAMVLTPSTLTWPAVVTGAVNQLSNDPTRINNTGNYNGSVSVTARDLLGETNPAELIPASGFRAGPVSGTECTATALVNNTITSVAGSNSNPGNLSAGGGQGNIYYCIPLVPSVSSQVYSTTTGGSWEVRY